MYAAQVEWWYAAFPSQDITLICTEDLKYNTTKAMGDLSDFLGLPTFDYTDIVSEGMYNVKGHQGYDKAVSWEEEQEAEKNDTIPLSAEFRKELQVFFDEHNERLFALTGTRCPW
uniref:Sulfotransferase domain-containing protein n=1 Tax=Leptocylindrus danicus TaxID=163516 RepID=A0A6U2MZF6_9STRA|mmetsp:Transcript_19488/g.29013  ORF Transcript_19488/g.29013 Transcript_19488/m.29013 type:complete len:115 (+) Transcript_19488:2-346(+)